MSIAAGFAADKEAPFRAAPAASYEHHLTDAGVTIGVDPYTTGDKVKVAFGKLVPYQYGVLPVLVVIQNDSNQAIRVDRMKVEFTAGSERIEATPAKEVRYAHPTGRPKQVPIGPPITIKSKNPLNAWEIEGRAFAAQMVEPGGTASGFFYFQADLKANSTIILSGITEAKTGKELLFFEIPLK